MLLHDYPSIVEYFSSEFKDCFSSETDYKQFKRAISGFMISDNKTIEAMNRLLIVDQIDQSNFNRFFHRIGPQLYLINEKRLALLQATLGTRFKDSGKIRGVLSIDNSLLKHYGKCFDNISYQWDYTDKRFCWSHDLVTLHYSDDETDYPVYFKLWKPADWSKVIDFYREKDVYVNESKVELEQKDPKAYRDYARDLHKRKADKFPSVKKIYKTKLDIAEDLVAKFKAQYPDLNLPIILDSGFASGKLCRKIKRKYGYDYVGAKRLKHAFTNEQGEQEKFQKRVDSIREQIAQGDLTLEETSYQYRGEKEIRYTYTFRAHVNSFKKKQNIVISFTKADASSKPLVLVTNRYNWKPSGILRMWRHRWPVETYHQEGKAEGLEDYQVRNWEAIRSYIHFIAVTYSMLKSVSHHPVLLDKLQQDFPLKIKNNTLPFLRRLVKAEGLMLIIQNAFLAAEQGQSFEEWFRPLLELIAY